MDNTVAFITHYNSDNFLMLQIQAQSKIILQTPLARPGFQPFFSKMTISVNNYFWIPLVKDNILHLAVPFLRGPTKFFNL